MPVHEQDSGIIINLKVCPKTKIFILAAFLVNIVNIINIVNILIYHQHVKCQNCEDLQRSQECTTSTGIRANFWALFFILYFALFLCIFLYLYLVFLFLGRPYSDVGAAALLPMMTNETTWPEAEISWSDP